MELMRDREKVKSKSRRFLTLASWLRTLMAMLPLSYIYPQLVQLHSDIYMYINRKQQLILHSGLSEPQPQSSYSDIPRTYWQARCTPNPS